MLSKAVKTAAVAGDAVRPPAAGLVVLIYHRVGGGSNSEVDLPVDLFEEQMAELSSARNVVTLTEGLHLCAGGASNGRETAPVAVTFDDGTADFCDHAVPVLEHHGIPATLYLATQFVDEQIPFPDGAAPVSWAGLADACASGVVDVGSHTHRHRLLDRLPAGEIADELDRSISLIGEHLGRPADHFAYPKAVRGTDDADAAVRARFRSAAVAGTHSNPFGATDPYQLARSPIQLSDGMTHFRRKAAGGMALEDTLRRVLNRARYSGAIT